MKIAKLNISGMHCSACSHTIESNLKKIPSLQNIKINAISGKAKITYEESQISEEEIIQTITSYGFPTSKDESKKLENDYILGLKRRLWVGVPLFSIIFILHMGGFHSSGFIQLILASIVQFFCGYPFYKGALNFFKTKSADMNVLITLGTSVAYGYSLYLFFAQEHSFYFEGSSAVICFVLVGEYLKAKAKKTASDDLEILSKLLPPKARILQEGKEIWKEINTIKKGEVCLVLAGEKIALDGIIEKGVAEVSSAHINGEEMPKAVGVNDEVIGGSLVINGEILVRSTKDSSEFFVYEMLDILELSQTKKPPIGLLADKIAAIFVPLVILASLGAFIFWLIMGESLGFALAILASVLIVSCPCALGLAVPLAIVCGITRAKKAEILIKSPEIFEKAKNIKTIVFDKTGTLTKGEIMVCDAEIFGDKTAILSLAKAMQEHNPHPISKAILTYVNAQNIPQNFALEEREYLIAKGVVAKAHNQEYYFGALNWIETCLESKIPLQDKGNAIALCTKEALLAIFYLQDSLKEGAEAMIKSFQTMGINPIILSGDNPQAVGKIAQDLGITTYFANLTPTQKVAQIEKLKEQGELCFVGDGINDALALKAASFGISFVNATELAKEVGDVLLLREDLKGLVEVFKLSSLTLKNIRQNLFFAYVYNIVLIPIAMGFLSPWGILLQPAFAGGAMALSSISVVSNALRIIKAKL